MQKAEESVLEKRNVFVSASYLTLDTAIEQLDQVQQLNTIDEARSLANNAQQLLLALAQLRDQARVEMNCE